MIPCKMHLQNHNCCLIIEILHMFHLFPMQRLFRDLNVFLCKMAILYNFDNDSAFHWKCIHLQVINAFYVYWRSWSKTFFLNEWTHFLKQRYYSFLYVSLQPHIFMFVRRIAKWCIFNSFKLRLFCPIFVYYHVVVLVWKILCFNNIREQNKHYNKWIF